MKAGSLFSGIGGLDLGLERAGMEIRWQSEIDPYCCRVLAKHWPNIPNLGDVRHVDWSRVEPVDLICGGYPCQPFSLAGVRRGEDDPRHLWPWFAVALRELRPRWALLENVPGHLSLGFGQVLGDLAELGYDTEWDCIPAAAVGAPHLRYRIFVVAHAVVRRGRCEDIGGEARGQDAERPAGRVSGSSASGLVPDAQRNGVRQQPVALSGCGGAPVAVVDGEERAVADAAILAEREPTDEADAITDGGKTRTFTRSGSQQVADAASIGSSNRDAGAVQGRPVNEWPSVESERCEWWAVEPDVGRVAHGVPARVDRLRALGNAVVPQVAEWVGRRIMEAAA